MGLETSARVCLPLYLRTPAASAIMLPPPAGFSLNGDGGLTVTVDPAASLAAGDEPGE